MEGSLVIEDLGSLNGTWVNDSRIGAPTLILPGEVVKLGTDRDRGAGGIASHARRRRCFPREVAAGDPAEPACEALDRRDLSQSREHRARALRPLILYAVMAGGLGDITKIKGFPTDSITTWAWTILFAQGAMMLISTTGTAIATDIEHGFISRLALTPLRGIALILAQLVGVPMLALLQSVVFLGVGLLSGARFKAGIPGALACVALYLVA